MKRFAIAAFILAVIVPSVSSAGIIGKPANNLGLVGYWSFNEGSGTTAGDSSGKRNTGSIVNSPSWVAGKIGKAISFDGDTQYVDIGKPASLDMTGAITMAAWVKFSDVSICYSGGCDIISNYDATGVDAQFEMSMTNGEVGYSTVNGGVNTGNTTNTTPITQNNRWYHIVITRNNTGGDRSGDTLSVYVDGVAQTHSIPTAIPPSQAAAGNTAIGRDGDITNPVFYFPGVIDEVRIYNRNLSATEVSALYKSGGASSGSSAAIGSGALANGLVGHWTMDGADVTDKVYDKSGSANHGYFKGSATSSAKTLGQLGQALRFNGTNSQISAGSGAALDDLDTITISAWIKPDSDMNASGEIFDKTVDGGIYTDGPDLWYDPTDSHKLLFAQGFNGGNQFAIWYVSSAITRGQWQHVAVVYSRASDANTPVIYINGVPQTVTPDASFTAVGTARSDSSADAVIGAYGSQNTTSFFKGLIDDVRVYNRMLGATEIKQLYNLGSQKVDASSAASAGGINSGLIGYWTFDGADFGATITDKSGQGNHGYVIGGATSTMKRMGKIGQAVRFDGTNDSAEIGTSNTYNFTTGNFSIALWLKVEDAFYDTMPIIYRMENGISGWSLTTNVDKPEFLTSGNGGSASNADTSLRRGVWEHVTVVRSGGTMYYYLNGVSDGSGAFVSPASNAGDDLTFGTDDLASYIAENLDDVRIYNRALTATEVKQLYNLVR